MAKTKSKANKAAGAKTRQTGSKPVLTAQEQFDRAAQANFTAALFGAPLIIPYIFTTVCQNLAAASALAYLKDLCAGDKAGRFTGVFKCHTAPLRRIAGVTADELFGGLERLRQMKAVRFDDVFTAQDLLREDFYINLAFDQDTLAVLILNKIQEKTMNDMAQSAPSTTTH
jgi:hypothetical protein